LSLNVNQNDNQEKCLRTVRLTWIMTSLPAATSNSDCRYRSHPDCRATEAKRVLMEKLGYELKESLETAINRDAKEIEAIASKFTEDSGTRKAFRACIDDYDLAFTVLRWLALMESIWCE